MLEQGQQDLSLDEHILPTPSPQSTPEQKLRAINDLKARKLEPGETWYVISRKWYRQWDDMCSGRVSKGAAPITSIGPVDNIPITTMAGELVPGLIEGVNMELVPEQAWRLFEEWYVEYPSGHLSFPKYYARRRYGRSGLPQPRKVISVGKLATTRVELYPPALFIAKYTPNHPSTFTRHVFSAVTPLKEILAVATDKTADQVKIVHFDEPDELSEAGFALTKEAYDAASPSTISTAEDSLDVPFDEILRDGDYIAVCVEGEESAVDSAPVAPPAPPAPIFTPEGAFFGPAAPKKSSGALVTTTTANGFAVNGATTKASAFKAPAPPARVRGTVGLNNL